MTEDGQLISADSVNGAQIIATEGGEQVGAIFN